MTKQAQVLVVMPHPDDVESRMGGTVARWTREGKDIIYVVCTNGDKGTNDPNIEPQELAKIREKEQLAAAEILGISRNFAHELVKQKQLPVIQFGKRFLIPRIALEKMLSESSTNISKAER